MAHGHVAAVAAIKVDDVATLRRFLAEGGDPNSTDGTAKGTSLLHWASYLGSAPCAEAILSAPHARVNITEVDGKTPLHWAAFEGHSDVIEILCQHGAVADVYDSLGHTPYALAIMQKHHEAAGLLKLISDHQKQQQQQLNGGNPRTNGEIIVAVDENPTAAETSPARSVAAIEPPVLLVPRALSPVQQLEALRASSTGSRHRNTRRDVWPSINDESSVATSSHSHSRSLQQPQASANSTHHDDDKDDDMEFELEAETHQRRAFLDRVRREQQTSHATSSDAPSQSRGGSAEATERLLDDARAHVEQHERRVHGTEFGPLDEELRLERLEAARQERRALEKEQRRIDKMERKLARQDARRRRRAEWLEQVMRLAALSHDVPRDDYLRIMEHVAQSYSSVVNTPQHGQPSLSRGTSLSRQSSSSHPARSEADDDEDQVVPPHAPSPFTRTQAPLEGPRDAAQWLPNPQPHPNDPSRPHASLSQHVQAVPPLSLAHWRNQLANGIATGSAPNTGRSGNNAAQSRSTSARSGPSSARSRVREPATRYPPQVELFVPLSQVLDRRSGSARPRSRSSRGSGEDGGVRLEAWKPPAFSRIEDVTIRAFQVTTTSRSRSQKPVTAKVNARR